MLLTPSDRRVLEVIRTELEACISLPPTKTDLISRHHISEDKLTRGFKQVYGKGIYQYWLHAAMHRAKVELASGVPAKDLAHRLGYSTEQNFIRAFKTVHGDPPGRKMRLMQK